MSDDHVHELEEVQDAWNYPLFDAIFNRRSRRFPVGCEIPHGPNAHTSENPPEPLNELEEAMILAAATGVSGSNLADMPHSEKSDCPPMKWDGCCNTMTENTGRTYASPCGSHGTEVFFTNDDGVYLYKMKDLHPHQMREYEGLSDADKMLKYYRECKVKIADGRLDLPRTVPIYFSFNIWNANMPGTTMFIPVSDVTEEYINAMMLMFEQGSHFVDDRNGGVPCGCEKFVKNGFLKGTTPSPLSGIEVSMTAAVAATESAFIAQNIMLANQAIGLGGWTFGGFVAQVAFGGTPFAKGLGFRHVTGKKRKTGVAMPVPVGIDGVFEAYCPPYYKTMSDAVDAIVEKKFGTDGIFSKDSNQFLPYKDSASITSRVPRTSEDVIDATKAVCEYIYATYGRFPAHQSPMQMVVWVQSHHLELEFYDKHYKEGAYTETQRRHMERWHGKKQPAVKAA